MSNDTYVAVNGYNSDRFELLKYMRNIPEIGLNGLKSVGSRFGEC